MSHVGCANRLGKKKKRKKKISIPITAGFSTYCGRFSVPIAAEDRTTNVIFYRMYDMVDRLNRLVFAYRACGYEIQMREDPIVYVHVPGGST